MTEDNVIDGPWEGGEPIDMTDEEYTSAMEELLNAMEVDQLSRTIAGVLEFLTVRAVMSGPFYITPDDNSAVVVFAAEDKAADILAMLPDYVKSWEDSEESFMTNRDPGDEQDEPTS
jgi:hypothetical protein